MIPEMKEQFNPDILKLVAQRYGLATEQLKDLGGYESFVYEFEKQGQSYILKINHTNRRTLPYLMGELEWLNYLADHGVSVARAVPSEQGRLVEALPAKDNSQFLAIAYQKAPGQRIAPEEWNDEHFQAWGQLIGKMHALTKDYALSNPAYKRQEWHEEEQLKWEKYVPREQQKVYQYAEDILSRIHALPQDRDNYGLIHTDLHHGNFFVKDGVITAFDFDDIGYNWFVNDIAIILYNVLWFPRIPYENRAEFAASFLRAFMAGYSLENQLESKWFDHMQDFLKLRHLLLYILFHQSLDFANLTNEEEEMVARYKRDIEENRPYVEIDDFRSIVEPIK